jgi:drug/metabolite transporter (DMT)-like permease
VANRVEVRSGLIILLAAVLWSTSGVCIKVLSDYSSGAVCGGRSLLAALFLIALHPRAALPGRRSPWFAFVGAVVYAATVSAFVFSTRLTTAANAIILMYTAPLWIALVTGVARRSLPTGAEMIALVIGGLGILLCLGPQATLFARGGGVTAAMMGDGVGLLSGLFYGVLILILRQSKRREANEAPVGQAESIRVLIWGNALTAMIFGGALVSEVGGAGIPNQSAAVGWLVLLWLGVGQLGGGYWVFQRGLRHTRALTASLISLIEPVLNPIWVALIALEWPARGTIAGGTLVLIAVATLLVGNSGGDRRDRGSG